VSWSVVVPFHLPVFSPRVADNVCRQEVTPDRVIIVGNGGGVAGLDRADQERIEKRGIEVVNVRCPLPHPSHARNRGKKVALELGSDWIAMIDSDDHYGPGFLRDLRLSARRHRLVGKRPHLVIDREGAFRVRYAPPLAGRVPWLTGAAQAYEAELARMLDYPVTSQGEDVMFCIMARRLGWEIHDTGPHDYVYERRGTTHQWQQNVRVYMARFQPVEPVELELPWFTTTPPGAVTQGDTE
jgi:glycosyltransferase involved in cell wall biosynthesis